MCGDDNENYRWRVYNFESIEYKTIHNIISRSLDSVNRIVEYDKEH